WRAHGSEDAGLRRLLLVVVDFGELRVDDIFLLLARGIAAAGSALRLLLLLVHGLAKLHRSLRQRIGLLLNGVRIVALQRFLQIGDGVLDRAAIGVADLRTMLRQRLLGGMHQRLGVVLGLD